VNSAAIAASVGNRGSAATNRRGPWLRASANRAPSHGGEGSRGVLSSANADDGDGSHARLREQRAQINSVGPSKYELQGPTSKPELSDVSS